jgi:mono/diheme cytochrome c family protein
MVRWPIGLILLATLTGTGPGDQGEVQFLKQVAPILMDRCVACHGPKKAFANFRLDTFARLMAESDAGRNIEPGRSGDSLFLELIVLNEPTGRMPKNADPLSEAEVKTLRRWIEQGAKSGGIDPDADLAGLVAKSKRKAGRSVAAFSTRSR